MQNDQTSQTLIRALRLLLGALCIAVCCIAGLCIYIAVYTQPFPVRKTPSQFIGWKPSPPKDTTRYWHAPDTATLSGPDRNTILYGRDLIAHTSVYFGKDGIVAKNAINGMNCQNCHLDAGTKVFGNNYGSVFSTYPKYRARSGTVENLYKRVNDCFARSLNGKTLDTNSREMQAIVAYINWLGVDVKSGEKAIGSGFKDLAFLSRACNPANGLAVYTKKCKSCHQSDGEGLYAAEDHGYLYPPLWGDNSYNDGAGLYRISNFAKYVKYNMPFGADHHHTQLSDEEAWDVAAYINSQPRPHLTCKEDWPKLVEKPVDHPYGPYADPFSETQHKFGPFNPIKAFQDSLKKRKTRS